MQKIIVLADIHIDDYRSETPGTRLNNYLKLAEIIRDKAIELNSPWIFIAGDILNRPVSPPHVLAVLDKFFKTLLESGARIAFITGQHDQNVKELENLKDTYLGIFCDTRIFYANKRSMTIEGTKIYFENFTRSNEVNPEQQSDVYISHVTLGMQKVHNEKFKLGIFGDIHDTVDIGNMHSVCPPLCVHAHEKAEGVIGILTVGDGEPRFERFEYDPEFKIFPKLEREYREVKTKTDLSEADKEVIDILSCDHDFYKDINATVEKMGLSEIHREVDLTHAPEPVSLDFKIHEIYARNFKSIKDVSVNLDNLGKVIFISGKIGSGKTSIIEALFIALLGDRNLAKNYQARWSDEQGVMVGVKLSYKGSDYEICRGAGWTKFIVNGEEVSKANKTALENYIYDTLPFLHLIWIFYIRTYVHFFDQDRVALVKKCFNLDIFDYLFNQGKLILQDTKNRLSKAMERNVQLKGRYEQEKAQLDTIIEDLKVYDGVDISELNEINKSLDSLRDALTRRALTKGKVESLKQQRDRLKVSLDKQLPDREYLEECKANLALMDKYSINMRSNKRLISNLEQTISNLQIVTCPKCGERFQVGGEAEANLKKQLEEVKAELKVNSDAFQNLFRLNISYTPKQVDAMLIEVGKVETLKMQLDKINYDLENEYTTLRDIDSELELLPQEKDLQDKKMLIEKKKMLLQNKINSETSLKNIISDAKVCQNERNALKSKSDECERYIATFDMKNLNSLPYKLLVKVSEFLSTDKMKFKTYSQLANGNLVLDISCELLVGKEYIPYDSCSHGQKTTMDFFILTRILELLNRTGIVAIDEGLNVVEPEDYNDICELIRNLDANNVLITSHQPGFTDYDSIITCTLGADGVTEVECQKS